MKIRLLLVLSMLSFSCQKENENQLLGSWKMKDVIDSTGQNVSDKITFYPNDSSVIEVRADGKLITQIKSKYVFDEEAKTLEINTGKFSVKYDIEQLDKDELVMVEPNSKTVIRNVRAD